MVESTIGTDLREHLFGFGGEELMCEPIHIVLPGTEINRKTVLPGIKNYRRKRWVVPSDDVESAFDVLSLLHKSYPERRIVLERSHEDELDGKCNVLLGGMTNLYTKIALERLEVILEPKDEKEAKSQIEDIRRFKSTKFGYQDEYRSEVDRDLRAITSDYCIVTRQQHPGRVDVVIAGLRSFGQQASKVFLSGMDDFYLKIEPLLRFLKAFPDRARELIVIVRVEVDSTSEIIRKTDVVDTFPRIIKVFASYNSKENGVNPILDTLRSDGVDIWWDKSEIKPADSITPKIEDGIMQSRYFALFIGSKQISGFQYEELKRAAEFNKKPFAVLLPGAPNIEDLKRKNAYEILKPNHILDLTDKNRDEIVNAIKKRILSLWPPPHPQ